VPNLSRFRPLAVAALVAGALAACGGDSPVDPPPPPPAGLSLATAGRLERGSTITLSATRSGQTVPAEQVAWTVTPADAVEALGGGQYRLRAAGALQVSASYDGSTGTLPVTVAAPPSVVFDMVVGGNRDLYRIALDGGDFARLTQDVAEDREPSVAGSSLVFVSFRAGNAELYSMALGGGAATRLTSTARAESSPALSPDGTKIAYAYDVSGVSRIWTANANGSGAAAFTTGLGFAGSPETGPSWAPTGNRLAFVTTAEGSADVWDLSAGGQPNVLAAGDSAEVDPAWSADGQRVAFASTREGDAAVFVVDPASHSITRLTTRAGTEAEPTWTADGRLVYVEFSPGSVTRLVWIDPAAPTAVNVIPVEGNPRRPSAIR
jgi:TolB protein